MYSNSDWAGCRESRKSTSGACFFHGDHLIKAYSKTQANIALSSAEAEYYSMAKAVSKVLGLTAMPEDYKQPLSLWVFVNAKAANVVSPRIGFGKLRHLGTQSLWLQDAGIKRVGLSKNRGPVNPADLMTKHGDHATQVRQLSLMIVETRAGRAESARETGVCAEQVFSVGSNIGDNDIQESTNAVCDEEL